MRFDRSSRFPGFHSLVALLIALLPALAVFAGNAGAAKGRVTQAKSNLDDGRGDLADDALNAAEKFLDGLSDDEKAPILKDITELRTKITAAKKAEESKRVEGSINRTLNMAESESIPDSGIRILESAVRTLQGDDAKTNLDEATAKKLQARIDALRAKFGDPSKPEEPKKPDGSGTPQVTANSEEARRIESSIARYITFAEDESNPTAAASQLASAAQHLESDDARKNLDAATLKKLQARIDALRAKLDATIKSDQAKRFADEIERHIRVAEENIVPDPKFADTRLADAAGRLESDEAKKILDAATLKKLQERFDAVQAKLGGSNKKVALDKAEPILKQLEERVAANPFKGADERKAYDIAQEINSLQKGVEAQINTLPKDDADRKAYEARLVAAQKKIDAADTEWVNVRVEASLAGNWKFTQQGFSGWDQETAKTNGRAFAPLGMGKTVQAVQNTTYWLNKPEHREIREKQKDQPKMMAIFAEAEKTLADATAKLDAAFNQWMDAAEKQPRPQGANRFDLSAASDMGRHAAEWFAGSKYKDANVARAKTLDEKWKAEIAVIQKQHEEALKKLTAEASAAWPKIEAALKPQDGFSPADAAAWKGKTIRLKGVRNRTGWDFDGQYDIVVWVDNQPLAGSYDPKVTQAFNDISSKIGNGIDDHIDWDVIAIVQGTGTANRRYTTEVKAADNSVIGKIEGARPMDCILIKVIAVHAGPVAVGP